MEYNSINSQEIIIYSCAFGASELFDSSQGMILMCIWGPKTWLGDVNETSDCDVAHKVEVNSD